jgi:sulfate transport system permease protein
MTPLPFFRTQRSILPGYRTSMGITFFWLTAIVLLPLAVLIGSFLQLPLETIWATASNPRILAAFKVSISSALLAAIIATALGSIVAWVLVRYEFPGRRLLDALIDIPFALPTAIAGIALSAIYAPDGWLGQYLQPLGIELVFNRAGIVLALIFIGMPFVVRSLQPVIAEIDPETEEAAASLGATKWQALRYVLFPQLAPAFISGFALAFARGLGEYGSVIFLAGNVPMVSEIVPLTIITSLEGYNLPGAITIAVMMLMLSFAVLYVLNRLQQHQAFKHKAVA